MRDTNEERFKETRKEIYRCIVIYIKEHAYPLSVTELETMTGITKQTVRKHLKLMVREGTLESETDPLESRAYRLPGAKVVKRRQT